MRKNTGCGCNGHDKCPPLPHCDFAHVKTTDCFFESIANQGDVEKDVIVGDVVVQALVEADVNLPTPAREIKNIRKNVSLKQCEAFPSSFGFGTTGVVKLFITGVVHKNIQYVEACSGFMRDFSVDIPFSCNVRVKNADVVDFVTSNKNAFDDVGEVRFIDKTGHEGDRCRFGGQTFEFFNEPIRCKLRSAEISEFDLLKDFDRFGRFNRITEKMEILLAIRLLQTRRFDVC